MDHTSEKPLSQNHDNTTSEIHRRKSNENDLKIIVRYHVVHPSPRTSRWTLKGYRVINTEILFPREISIGAARDFAIHHFPEAYPTPDFTHALVSYVRGEERYDVLDYSANLGEFLGSGERMHIFNDPNFFENRNLQLLFGIICLMISGILMTVVIRRHS